MSMFEWFPELILISEHPITWYGFLDVPCKTNISKSLRIKLKLIVPNHPKLEGLKIFFGKDIALLRGQKFSAKVQSFITDSTTVLLFLRQLQSHISNVIDKSICSISSNTIYGLGIDFIKEIQNVLIAPSEVQLSACSNLNIIKLSVNNVSITLTKNTNGRNQWSVIASELPELPALGPFEKDVSLVDAIDKFKQRIEILGNAWHCLRQLDQKCWIIDPLDPKPHHLYRRIYCTPSLSMLLLIDPFNPTNLPEIKFLGSDAEVEKQMTLISDNLVKWDSDCDIVENLLNLLDIEEFPQKVLKCTEENVEGIVSDEECCICFALKLDNGQLPDKICSNEKCRRHFHTYCLLQWLQAVAGNQVVFDTIHGSCPHCGENISCSVKL